MDSDNEQPAGPPERVITPNMLAAYNMARWRKAAGMTQEELGAELGGWTKGNVSAAERSWDGKDGRVRQFDADLICDLAAIFRIPVPAFFLPPPDDGTGTRYVIRTDDGGGATMHEFFPLLWPEPNWAPDSPAAAAYQKAVIAALARYGPGEGALAAAEAVAGSVADAVTQEVMERELRAARENRAALAGLHDLIDRLADDNRNYETVLEQALAGKRGRP